MSGFDMYIYVIARKDGDDVSGPVKVGITKSLGGRLSALQTGSPHELVVVHALRVPTRDIATEMEECFHGTQRAHRMKGEWFDLDPYDAVVKLCLHFRFLVQLQVDDPAYHERIFEACGVNDAPGIGGRVTQ